MNSNAPRSPSDDELNQLLAARVRRTSPEFELRWRELRASFAKAGRPPRRLWPRWLMWPGLATAVVAGVIVALTLRTGKEQTDGREFRDFDQLIGLDDALAPAQPLLEPETRDAVLNLPVPAMKFRDPANPRP